MRAQYRALCTLDNWVIVMNLGQLGYLARTLAHVTFPRWPGRANDHFRDRCFLECVDWDLQSRAQEEGFHLLGVGNFTAVFGHHDAPGVVFKLNAGTRDNMEAYHRWLMTQRHPNLPRVYSVFSYGDGCVAVSEELMPAEWGADSELPLAALRSILGRAGFDIDDAHPGNIMRRADGTVVLNDPSSNRAASRIEATPERRGMRKGELLEAVKAMQALNNKILEDKRLRGKRADVRILDDECWPVHRRCPSRFICKFPFPGAVRTA